ncbi:unnamed protein product [Durusdinium trenchii]|uniref:Uncharacterized protein n=1 Tax=Durusdinium trenchii TaxID=1381693 RepID=A0ABP0SXQ4_9DINO
MLPFRLGGGRVWRRLFSSAVMSQGKCKGLTHEECLAQMPQYCSWLLTQQKSLGKEYDDLKEYLLSRAKVRLTIQRDQGFYRFYPNSLLLGFSLRKKRHWPQSLATALNPVSGCWRSCPAVLSPRLQTLCPPFVLLVSCCVILLFPNQFKEME